MEPLPELAEAEDLALPLAGELGWVAGALGGDLWLPRLQPGRVEPQLARAADALQVSLGADALGAAGP